MIDWRDLRHFLALARHGTLSGAARELRVDHATVGRRIAALERALALRLVDRLSRGAALTSEGKRVAELLAPMEGSVRAVERLARVAAASPAASVRVSAPPALAAYLIAPRVAAFHRAHGAISIVLSAAAAPANLERGEADVAVRMGRPQGAGLVARRIGVVRFGLYASAAQAASPPGDWRFIGYDAALDHVASQAWLRDFVAGRRIVFRASDLFSQAEAARAGLGAAVLPRFMGVGDPALVELPLDRAPPRQDLWLVAHPDIRRAPSVRAAMAFLAETIGRACPLADRDDGGAKPPRREA